MLPDNEKKLCSGKLLYTQATDTSAVRQASLSSFGQN